MNTFKEGYKRQYITKSGSFQHIFCIFIWYLILALPFYFSFGDEKFWLKPKNQILQCKYNFTGYYAMQVTYVANKTQFFSQQQTNIVGSSWDGISGLKGFSVKDEVQQSSISFSLTDYGVKQIQNLNIILYYNIWIEELEKEISAAYVHNINGNLAYLESVAVIRYEPQSQLNDIDNRKYLNYPAYLPDLKLPASFDVLINHIIENHEVHRLNHDSTEMVVKSQGNDKRYFLIKLIKDTKVNIPYYPSVLQTLKFSFSRWLAFVMIGYFVFYKLMEKLVKDGGLVTTIKDETIKQL